MITTHFLFNLPEKKVLYKGEHVSKIRDFKTRFVLTMKFNSATEKILKLLLNIRIIISSNKIRLLQKQRFVYVVYLKIRIMCKYPFFWHDF